MTTDTQRTENVALPIGPEFALLDLACRLLPDAAGKFDLTRSSWERIDEARNRWRVRLVNSRRQWLATVEADMIDRNGDQTAWEAANVTVEDENGKRDVN